MKKLNKNGNKLSTADWTIFVNLKATIENAENPG